MKKTAFLLKTLFLLMLCAVFVTNTSAQKKRVKVKLGKICGNPQVECHTGELTFQPHEIPFEIPPNGNAVIVQSKPFYTVILKSVKLAPEADCENVYSETERLQIQQLFPDHKVFALKCLSAGDLYYENIASDVNFIAVYAGKNLAEAKQFLETVKAKGKFKGVNLRRTQASINGT